MISDEENEVNDMSFFSVKQIGFCFLSALLIYSCAPSNEFVRTGPSYAKIMAQVKRITLINDACIGIAAGDGYFSIWDTKSAESLMLESAKAYLEKKGYVVAQNFAPFVCAVEGPDRTFKVAEKIDAPLSDLHAPFFTSDKLISDEEYKQALLNVVRQILPVYNKVKQIENTSKDKSEATFVVDNEARRNLQIISSRTDAEDILFIVGNGTVVPAGKQLAQSVGTAILTLGMFSYRQVSALDAWAVLIDVNSGEILWSNSLRMHMNPSSQDSLSRDQYSHWARNILYHLPSTIEAGK